LTASGQVRRLYRCRRSPSHHPISSTTRTPTARRSTGPGPARTATTRS